MSESDRAGEAKPSPRFFTHVFAGGVPAANAVSEDTPQGKRAI